MKNPLLDVQNPLGIEGDLQITCDILRHELSSQTRVSERLLRENKKLVAQIEKMQNQFEEMQGLVDQLALDRES